MLVNVEGLNQCPGGKGIAIEHAISELRRL